MKKDYEKVIAFGNISPLKALKKSWVGLTAVWFYNTEFHLVFFLCFSFLFELSYQTPWNSDKTSHSEFSGAFVSKFIKIMAERKKKESIFINDVLSFLFLSPGFLAYSVQ